jgi:dCMP deaminase
MEIIIPKTPDWDNFFLDIAEKYSKRAQCMRRQYAALIVNDRHRQISAGYNGAPRLCKSSLERGQCYRMERHIPTGSNYELCRSIHAEQNAIMQIGLEACKDKTLYLFGWDVQNNCIAGDRVLGSPPCLMCMKLIVQAEIKKVVFKLPTGRIRTIENSQMIDKINRDDFDYPY